MKKNKTLFYINYEKWKKYFYEMSFIEWFNLKNK